MNDEPTTPSPAQPTPPTPTAVEERVETTEPEVATTTAPADLPTNEPEPTAIAATEFGPPAAEAPAPEPASTMPEPPAPVEAPAPPPAPTPAPAPAPAMDDASLFEAALASLDQEERTETTTTAGFRKLAKGDRIEATVIQVERDRVFVDLGTKSEGVVPLAELTEENLETAEGHVAAGDKISVVVLRPEGADGNAIVSKKRADFEDAWQRIVDSYGEGSTLTAQVVDRVKGGLVVDIGVRGFVPATHVGNGKLRNIEKYVGQVIALKILEIDRERKKVVLSNKNAEDERREQVKQEIFTRVAPGEILEGTVRRLTDYGAFVDLGGVDGLLHISEMSWMRINHPREVLKEGQKIKVMVLRLDSANGKISLGLRQVLPDPWNLIRENYRVGQKIQCVINRLVQSGAFVKLPEGAEAFLPISEMSTRRIGRPSDVLAEGQEVELTIIDLKPDDRRMVLSLRSGMPHEPMSRESYDRGGGGGGGGGFDDDRFGRGRGMGPGGKKAGGGGGGGGKRRPGGGGGGGGRGRDEEIDDYDGPIIGRVPTGGATIGERLGMLKGFLGRTEDEEETEIESTDAVETAEPASAADEKSEEKVEEKADEKTEE